MFRTFKLQIILSMSYPYQIKSQEQYEMAYRVSVNQPEEFWASVAENFQWRKKWDKVLEWNFKEPSIKWFQGGKLNITENCIDRHLKTMGEKPAFIWEPNDPNDRVRVVTYNRLHKRVCQVAQMLKNNRSEERRVGKECRSRWSRYHEKKKGLPGAAARGGRHGSRARAGDVSPGPRPGPGR